MGKKVEIITIDNMRIIGEVKSVVLNDDNSITRIIKPDNLAADEIEINDNEIFMIANI